MVTLDTILVLALVVLALVLFVTEVVRYDIVALIIMALLMVLQILTPLEGISGFANTATITILAMFILSGGIQKTGLINLAAQKILGFAGRDPFLQVLLITAVIGGVSAFVNNTAAVAIMLPMAVAMARDTGGSPSKLLMPLSFASMLGGTLTLIGTSTNLLANGLLEELGLPGLSLFTFTQVGLIVFFIGMAYLLTVGYFLLPTRVGPEDVGPFRLEEYLAEVRVPEESPFVGQAVSETFLHRVLGIDVLEVIREHKVRRPPLDMVTLRAGDIMVISGSRDELQRVSELGGLDLVPELEEEALALTSEDVSLVEVVIPPTSRLIGHSLAGVNFHERYSAQVVAVSKTHSRARKRLKLFQPPNRMHKRPLESGDLLLLQVRRGAFTRLERDPDLLVAQATPLESFRRERAPVALAIMVGVVAVAAVGLYPIVVTAVVGAVLMVLTGCLRAAELYTTVQWDVIILIGALIPLGLAMVKTGAAELIASSIASLGAFLPPVAILMVLFALTSLLTSVVSNNATVLVMLPVGVTMALALGLNPLTFALAVMFAASTSFLTPTGYQTNTLVWGPGGYPFTDFTRVGGPLTAILSVVTPLALALFFPL